MITFDNTSNLFTPDRAERMIDKALAAGYQFSALRWRVSQMQRRCMRKCLLTYSDLATLRQESEHGHSRDTGLFAGIPYVVDSGVPDDEVVIEVVTGVERIGRVDNVGVE